jgi:nicotinate-nucleotide pyrophosphorylase (carboxylating)
MSNAGKDYLKQKQAQTLSLIDLALNEDLGDSGDITSLATIPEAAIGKAAFVSRKSGRLAGLEVLRLLIEERFPAIQLQLHLEDGTLLQPKMTLATLLGPIREILKLERTALNFLQRLSGIATITHQYVDLVAGTKATILDTRKTTPGWRHLEKYAVRCGGGQNHRIGLYDAFLIKDNHLAGVRSELPLIPNPFPAREEDNQPHPEIPLAIERCRRFKPGLPVEVEVDSLEQFVVALACTPEIILIDNFSIEDSREAVRLRDEFVRFSSQSGSIQLEASGGVNLNTVRAIAETGVDRISIGALTHSAVALDLGLDYLD